MSEKKCGNRRFLLLFFIFVSVNVCLDVCYFWNYRDKMNILERLLQADSGLLMDAAADILKSDALKVDQGYPMLARYGYVGNFRNRFYIEFIRACVVTCAASVGLLFLIRFVDALSGKRENAVHEVYFWQLRQSLAQFQEGTGNGQQLPALDGYESAAARVNEQLERFLEYLEMAHEQACQDRENIKRLVTDISHQLKTPVAALDACLSVLLNEDLNHAERLEFERRCESELEGLKALLDSLLRVSQLEAGMIQIELRKAPVLDTVINAINRVYLKASDKRIEFDFDHVKEIEGLMVLQDTKWLCEALINVLDNAVKYSPEGSKVTIGIQKFISFVRIEIADHGFGIPKQECHKVFKRFYRVDDKRVREESGSGVGLYLTREIIEKHKGTISVKSDCGPHKKRTGCRFVIQLPYCKD